MAIKKNQICAICGNRFTIMEGLFLRDLSDLLKEQVLKTNSFAKESSFVCLKDLQSLRLEHMQAIIDQDLKNRPRDERQAQKGNGKGYLCHYKY
jgi:hypothetical protein